MCAEQGVLIAGAGEPAVECPAEPGSVTAEELLYLIQDWFAHHILGTDMEFKDFSRS